MHTQSIEVRVRAIIAEMTGSGLCTALAAGTLDSLTVVAIVARIEAAFAVSFETDETIALLEAGTESELARLIARKVPAQSENLDETAGNNGCRGGQKAS